MKLYEGLITGKFTQESKHFGEDFIRLFNLYLIHFVYWIGKLNMFKLKWFLIKMLTKFQHSTIKTDIETASILQEIKE